MAFQQHTPSIAFRKWIWQNRERRWLLALSGAAIIIQFIVFKYQYPFPNFLPDSYSYMEAAFNNQFINMWPIGYSKFLRLFSVFTKSHTALTLFQYVFLQGSVLYLLFTIAYLFYPGKWVLRILLACSVLNPLLLHVSNFVSSDALFATLSLVWFTQLLWIIYKPGMRLLVVHAVVLLLVFTVRYNALYYPLISLVVIGLSHIDILTKVTGIACIVVLLGIFIGQTLYQYHSRTGIAQFSAFGGWQLASNALFAYANAEPEASVSVPSRFNTLHTLVNQHMDSLNHLKHRPDGELGIYYLWDEQAPLKKYMHQKYSKDSTTDSFKQWASMGPLYTQYGKYLIQQRPAAFIKYYLWPNMVNYYVPPSEFLGFYNMGKDSIEPMGVAWFGLKSNKMHQPSKDGRITAPEFFPIILAIVNLLFIVCFISFVLLDGFKKAPLLFKKTLLLMLCIWVCNTGFSILASPIVLRYQLFPMVVTFTFMLLLLTFVIQESESDKKAKEKNYRKQEMDVQMAV